MLEPCANCDKRIEPIDATEGWEGRGQGRRAWAGEKGL